MKKGRCYVLLGGMIVSAIFIISITNFSSALPPIEGGIGIGGVIIDGTTGEPLFNVADSEEFNYYDIYGTNCFEIVLVETGDATNSFYLDAYFLGCPLLEDYGAIGSLGAINPIQTTVISSAPAMMYEIEIVSLSRTTPNTPISITIEIFGYPHTGESLRMTPNILDENDNLLFQGSDAIGNAVGTGANGAPIYSFTLDPIPSDVTSANIIRRLEILLVSVSGGVSQNHALFEPFPLTYGCIELLHLGPAGFVSPTPINATFGCPGLIPPGTCEDSTSAAIALSRDYQKATRSVIHECVKKQTSDCSNALQHQEEVYNQLVEAQSNVEMYCP